MKYKQELAKLRDLTPPSSRIAPVPCPALIPHLHRQLYRDLAQLSNGPTASPHQLYRILPCSPVGLQAPHEAQPCSQLSLGQPAYQRAHSSWSHCNRRAHITHIGNSPRTYSFGDQKGVCC